MSGKNFPGNHFSKQDCDAAVIDDDDSKFYKLMIVVYLGGDGFEAECYDSNIGIWSRMHDGFISGKYMNSERFCTFDCAKGLIINICPKELYEYSYRCMSSKIVFLPSKMGEQRGW